MRIHASCKACKLSLIVSCMLYGQTWGVMGRHRGHGVMSALHSHTPCFIRCCRDRDRGYRRNRSRSSSRSPRRRRSRSRSRDRYARRSRSPRRQASWDAPLSSQAMRPTACSTAQHIITMACSVACGARAWSVQIPVAIALPTPCVLWAARAQGTS